MDEFEDLLLAGDLDEVNEVLSRTGALNIVDSAPANGDSPDALPTENIAIPDEIYPKVCSPLSVHIPLLA